MAGRMTRSAPAINKKPPKIKNPEKLKDPKYALALHLARVRLERRGGRAPLTMR